MRRLKLKRGLRRWGIEMTPEQLTTLRDYILSVQAWAALPVNSDTSYFIADELRKEATPAFVVWRSSVPQDEIMQNGFDWVFVQGSTFVLRLNFCAKNPRLRQYPKR